MKVVYGLYDPRVGPHSIRYVGITARNMAERIRGHCYESRKPECRTTRKRQWIGGLLDEGVRPAHIILVQLSEADPLLALATTEAVWIERMKSGGHDLLNISGGRGGYRLVPLRNEARQRMSASKRGKTWSPERRRALSEAKKGIPSPLRGRSVTNETKAKMSQAQKGHGTSAETKAKISASNKGKRRSAQVRAEMSEIRERQFTPGVRAKISASVKAFNKSRRAS